VALRIIGSHNWETQTGIPLDTSKPNAHKRNLFTNFNNLGYNFTDYEDFYEQFRSVFKYLGAVFPNTNYDSDKRNDPDYHEKSLCIRNNLLEYAELANIDLTYELLKVNTCICNKKCNNYGVISDPKKPNT